MSGSTLFSDFRCHPPSGGAAEVLASSWCTVAPVLAVATSANQVVFYADEGVSREDAVINSSANFMKGGKPPTPTNLQWQPKTRAIAIGWSSGKITFHSYNPAPPPPSNGTTPNAQDATVPARHGTNEATPPLTTIATNTSIHTSPITFLLWNPTGTRLVTGDSSGVCAVWKAEKNGLVSTIQYHKNSALTTCVFCGMSTSSTRATLLSTAYSPSFFFGAANGTVSYADDLGHCTDVQQLASSVDSLMFYESKMRLVIITRSLLMTQLQVNEDGRVTPVMKVKLSVAGDASEKGVTNVVWAGPGLLTSACGENMIRFWDLAKDENYVLTLKSAGFDSNERSVLAKNRATSLSFNPRQRYLAVGTRDGTVLMWKFVGDYSSKAAEKGKNATNAADWKAVPAGKIEGTVTSLEWGPGQGLLSAGSEFGAIMLSETVLHRALNNNVAAIQVSPTSISVETKDSEGTASVTMVNADINVKGLVVDEKHVVVWNGKEAQVYEGFGEGSSQSRQIADFPCQARSIALRADTLFMAIDNRLLITNLQGVQRMSVSFTEQEGQPVLLTSTGVYLAIVTDNGTIKVFDVSRKEPKPIGSSGKFVDPMTNKSLGVIKSIAVNADGTRLAILADRIHGTLRIREPDSRVFVYDAENEKVDCYDFENSRRIPTGAFWDPKEPKLLAVETRKGGSTGVSGAADSKDKKGSIFSSESMSPQRITSEDKMDSIDANPAESKMDDETKTNYDGVAPPKSPTGANAPSFRVTQSTIQSNAEIEVTTMFVTSDYGIKLQDVLALEPPMEMLLGIAVPRLYFVQSKTQTSEEDDDARRDAKAESKSDMHSNSNHPTLCSTVMRDFVGLSDVDSHTLTALLDFSYFLTIGNMDSAYRAVKLIKNTTVWENMAHMCVKTKRLDVAEVCLGNMGYARGAAAVRQAKKEPEPEAAIAMVAIQLGLIEDAAKLYEECGRYDLLNKLYQGQGQWDKAIETATTHDRIHLKTTHHQYAKYLETIGDTAGAIRNFERADTYKAEVPRMLFDLQRMEDLEDYIMQGNDTELLKWWAGYCESLGHFEKARRYYARANDDLSLVRVACHNREMIQAAEIVNESNSSSAAYHLARQFEAMGEVQEAISYFSQSGCYNHAIRLSKAYGLDSELMSFALKSRPSSMIDCANYFEQKGEYEKAVQLFQKGGDNAKALDLCFRVGKDSKHGDTMGDVLKSLAENLEEGASAADLEKCAEYFISNNQAAKAIEILWKKAKKYDVAIDLCLTHKVKIDDEMAEGLTPPKSDDPVESERRIETLKKLAKACKKQNVFHLACKKYTQAGDRLKAMKCLLKSGDTKNIIYYAGASRNKDIYVLAANYLQSLDWHNDNEIMKNIILFYTKSKAFEQLASFYEACSQVEIDEYRDYDKALGALKEAKKHIEKVKPPTGASESMAGSLFGRISVVERFVAARRDIKSGDGAEAERICKDLLDGGVETEQAIRVGDCFALLIEYYYGEKRMDDAFYMMENMKDRGIVLKPYLEMNMMSDICESVGKNVGDLVGGGGGRGGSKGDAAEESGDFDDDDIGEELDESLGESMGEESNGGSEGERK